MNKKTKKILSFVLIITLGLYAFFLLSPLVVTPILRRQEGIITELVKKSTGLEMTLKDLSFTTSWNLAVGVKAKNITLQIPSNESKVFEADNIGGNLELLPILIRKIQLGKIYAKNISANLDIKKDGSLLVVDYFPQNEEPVKETFTLPFGLKLSNKLPNVKIDKYNLSAVDLMTSKKYSLIGENLKITDFILDKKVKLKTDGKVVFDEVLISNYDIKVFNKIMPNLKLNDLIFPENVIVDEGKETQTSQKSTAPQFNVLDILKSIDTNKFTADIKTDLTVKGTLKNPAFKGLIDVQALSVAVDGKKLPESYINLKFKGNNTNIDSILFSSSDENEKTQIIGSLKTGHKPYIDMTLRSNAKFMNLINLVDSLAKSFNINDFDTLSATGGIDADFNVTSDMKKVSSNGYLKILPSKFKYGLYNVLVDKITADINFDNGININHAGFSIFNHPLTLTGTISQDATTDLKIVAEKLSVKGLLAAVGQAGMLKDNDITSGVISLNALIKGTLTTLKPELTSILEGLEIYNKPSATHVNLSKLSVNAAYDGKALLGDIDLFGLVANNEAVSVKIPDTCIQMDNKDITINKAYMLLNNSKIDITGGVEDYATDKPAINILAKGKIQSADIIALLPKEFANLIISKGSVPISIDVTGNSKVQNLRFSAYADKDNYVSFVDIDKLKNKKTKIKANFELLGDTLNIIPSGIYEGNNLLVKLSGNVSKLYTQPKLNIELSVPETLSFPIWGVNNSNISANGAVTVGGTPNKPTIKGSVSIPDISMKDVDFAITDLRADLSGEILNGNAYAKKVKAGGLIAEDASGKISLKDYNVFTLSDITAKAFDGNIKGKLSYEINSFKTGLDIVAQGLNASNAIYGAVGIKDALTGTMNFTAKLGMQGLTDVDIIKSMKGNINFDIQNGRFVGIGRLENLVAAQNITSNSILKAAISSLSTLSALQETDKFKAITGEITLNSGTANLSKIIVSGPLMSYYATGSYYILQNTANMIILGRLDSKVVSMLGVIGDLSVEKLLSSIPKLGTMTATVWNQLTANPNTEDLSKIPALSSGSTTYKDFKVSYSGVVGAASSVRYFKWLASTGESSDINLKQDLKNAKDTVKENVKTKVENTKADVATMKNNVNNIVQNQKNKVQTVKKSVTQTKENLANTKENAKQTSENLKNLLHNAIINSIAKPSTGTSTSSTSASTTTEEPATAE